MTHLLVSVPHFNFRSNLLTTVISYMPITDPKEVSVLACNCICTLFKDDEQGELSLEAVKLVSKLIKSRSFRVPEQVINTFLHLRLKDELVMTDEEKGLQKPENKRKDKTEHHSKKMRKVMKVDSEVEKEMKEAEAVYDKEERKKMVC
jgi:nucleolar complex protein 3